MDLTEDSTVKIIKLTPKRKMVSDNGVVKAEKILKLKKKAPIPFKSRILKSVDQQFLIEFKKLEACFKAFQDKQKNLITEVNSDFKKQFFTEIKQSHDQAKSKIEDTINEDIVSPN
jgi:hypothetical protein